MSVTVLVPATSRRLTSVDAVIQDIGAEGLAGHLPLVESLIDQASAAIERYCGTIFAQQTYVEIIEMVRAKVLALEYFPVLSSPTVLFGSTAMTDHRLYLGRAGLVYRPNSWWSWPGLAEISLTYTAGYLLPEQAPATAPVPTGPTLPGDLERACIEATKVWLYERLPQERIASKTFGLTGDRIDYGISALRTAIPILAQRLLDPWRRLRVA